MFSRKVAFAAIAGLVATSASGQGNVAQGAAQTVQVVQARAANVALMKQFTWNECIDFLVKGQQKDLRIGELLHGYTLPTPGAAMNFLDSTVPVPSGPGQLMVTGQNVVQPADSLTIYLDAVTRKTQRVVVNTAFQGDAVNLTATFATLPDGLDHPAYAELLVPANGYAIQVQNFNFQQNGM